MHLLLRFCVLSLLLLLPIRCGKPTQALSSNSSIFHDLDRANNGVRSFSVRLSGPYRYGPVDGGGTIDFAAAARLKSRLFPHDSHVMDKDTRRAQAHYHFLFGGQQGVRQAMELLELLHIEHPDDPDILSDLAAACYALAELGENRYYWNAMETIAEGKDRDMLSPIGEFNYALMALKFTHRRWARDSLERYLKQAQDDEWAQEARRLLKRTQQDTHFEYWWRMLPDFEQALLEPSTDFLLPTVLEFIGASQRLIELKLVPEWASAYLDQRFEEADQAFRKAQALANLLEQINGDCMYGDLINHLLDARHDPAKLRAEAAALTDLDHAQKILYEQGRNQEARAELKAIFPRLQRLGNPLATRARFLFGICHSFTNQLSEGLAIFQQVREQAGPGYYRVLHGEADWMLAIYYMRSHQYALSFQAANYCWSNLGYFASLGHTTGAFCLLVDSSNAYKQTDSEMVAEITRQIDFYFQMVRGRRKTNFLMALFNIAETDGYWHISELLEDQKLTIPEIYQEPRERANALILMSETLIRRGKLDQARAYQQKARSMIPHITDDHSRTITIHQLSLSEAVISQNPEVMLARINEMLPFYSEEYGSKPILRKVVLQKASLLERLGQTQEALDIIEEQLRSFRSDTAGGTNEDFQIQHLEGIHSLVEKVIDLRLSLGDPQSAYLTHEEFRARALRLQFQAHQQTTLDQIDPWANAEQDILGRIQASLPTHALAFQYVVNGQHVHAVILGRDRFEWVTLACQRRVLTDAIKKYRFGLDQRRSSVDLQRLSSKLHDMLIKPLLPYIQDHEQLLIIPDDVLHHLSFAGSWDTQKQNYLAETISLATAPSALVYGLCLERDKALPYSRSPAALVIGDPQFDRADYPNLDRLPGARQGAMTIAELYPKHTLLLGIEASRDRFLDEIGRHEVVHFGGHADVNHRQPMESALILANNSASSGGKVTVSDLQQKSLQHTRLAILSGCSTGAGRVWAQEGQNNLARPFLITGVPGVLASSWDIDDEGTRELLTRFHRYLRTGSAATKALQAAQIDLIRGGGSSASPAIWSAFQLHGAAFKPIETQP